jgi:DNA-directed RNA polymerase subunit alpha
LQRHLDIFVNFGQLPEDVAEEEPEMTKEEIALYEKLRLPVSELELSVRSANCLREANIKILPIWSRKLRTKCSDLRISARSR